MTWLNRLKVRASALVFSSCSERRTDTCKESLKKIENVKVSYFRHTDEEIFSELPPAEDKDNLKIYRLGKKSILIYSTSYETSDLSDRSMPTTDWKGISLSVNIPIEGLNEDEIKSKVQEVKDVFLIREKALLRDGGWGKRIQSSDEANPSPRL